RIYRSSPALALTLLLGAAAATDACTALLEGEPNQCRTTDDCAARGPGFAGLVCDPAGLCVAPSGCMTNRECVDANGGAFYVCRQADHTCVSLLSEDCTKVLGDVADVANDNVVVYGLLLAQAGPAQSQSLIFLSKASEYAVEMARRDFKDANSGTVLPPAAPGGPPRPAVFVSCNDQVDPVRAANYLVNEIGVPAFIGPITSPAVQNVVSQVTIPHEALEIAPVASTVLLQRIQGKQFLFRTSATDEVQDDFTKAVINKYVEPWARAKYALPAPAPLKLSIVKRGDALGNGLASLLYPALEFNGKALAANGSNYLEVDYGADPSDAAAIANAVAQAVEFKPHIIVIVSTPEGASVMAQIEAAWTEPSYRPHFIMPLPAIGADYNAIVGADEDFRKRILLMNNFPSLADPLYTRFLTRYNAIAEYGSDRTTTVVNNPIAVNAYDDAYLLLFATIALGEQPITGANLSQAMFRLNNGAAFDIQNVNLIPDAIAALKAGQNINYHGVSGPVDFAANGDAPQQLQLVCLDPSVEKKPRTLQSGVSIDLTTLTLQGDLAAACQLP
ncbi:MAG: hypothetical protein MUF34_23590, partial [Polyangiaceae bacterium]|nr:hypothetical protein [Polyangiaceae bacterium]